VDLANLSRAVPELTFSTGLLLFLVASGLTLIFGIMGVINLAHGSFYMIGAYMAYALARPGCCNFRRAASCCTLVGRRGARRHASAMLLEWAFFSYLYQRDHLQQVLMTYGLILVFEELRSILVGNDVLRRRSRPPWLVGLACALGERHELSRGTACS
jgi:branched-chain amino acid transport system permease protein